MSKRLKIEIYIDEKDVNKIRYIGDKPWQEVTSQEKLDYQKLIEKIGSIVSQSIRLPKEYWNMKKKDPD